MVIPNRIYCKFTWWRYLNLTDEEVFGCWRPPLIPLPEYPCNILKPVESGCQTYQTRKELPDARNAQEEYERYYIFLSSVHDNYLQGVQKITEGIWSDSLSRAVLCCLDIGHGNKITFLKAALERICQSNCKTDKKKEQEARDRGDTYNINAEHVSLGDRSQHVGRDISTNVSETKKEKGIWANPYFKYILIPILVLLIGGIILENRGKIKEQIMQLIKTSKREGKTTEETQTTDDSSLEIIPERPAAVNYVIEFKGLTVINPRNHWKGEAVWLELFHGVLQENELDTNPAYDYEYILEKGEKSYNKKMPLYEFGHDYEETSITIRLCFKNGNERTQISNLCHIDLKETEGEFPFILKEPLSIIPNAKKAEYILTYRISQKESNEGNIK